MAPFENTITEGPMMADYVYQHCFARISSELAISIGGNKDQDNYAKTKGSYFYNLAEKQWTVGPELIEARSGHACGAIRLLRIPAKYS